MTCRHRWTGRYEAHLWDNTCRKEGQTRKGRQGEIDRAYDMKTIKRHLQPICKHFMDMLFTDINFFVLPESTDAN